jgi:hypothetical protein
VFPLSNRESITMNPDPPSRALWVTGDALEITGEQDMRFSLNNWSYRHTFCVCSLPTDADGILGTDFPSETNASLEIGQQVLRLQKRPMANHGPSHRKVERATRTVFREPGRERSPKTRSSNGKREKIFVLEVKRNPYSGTRDGHTFRRYAHIATVAMQHGSNKGAKHRKRAIQILNSEFPTILWC